MNEVEEYFNNQSPTDANKNCGIDIFATKFRKEYLILFAEAYHQSKLKKLKDDTQKAIDEFTRLQTKYPRMATVDVVEMLKRLIQDLKY